MPPPAFYFRWILAMVGAVIGGAGTNFIFQGHIILGLLVGLAGLLIFNKALGRPF